MYWELQGFESRFTYDRFSNLPQRILNQAIISKHQQENMRQLGQARAILLQIQINSDPKSGTPLPPLHNFLPYPRAWIRETNNIKVYVSKPVAIKILSDLETDTLPTGMQFALEPILEDLKACSEL